jgi:hypothetical protein
MVDRADKLVIGKYYEFLILKRLSHPGLEKDLIILEGPDSCKYILDMYYYEHYSLKTGQAILCRVDKINCAGQVFLEPLHPYYEEGAEYEFRLLGIDKGRDAWGKTLYSAIVEDVQNLKWNCNVSAHAAEIEGLSSLKCRIDKISKSELFLSSVDFPVEETGLLPGVHYDFTIEGVVKKNGKFYYSLKGPDERIHLLEKEYYGHYNFLTGQVIRAKIISRRKDLSYKIEPDNPKYRIGEIYDFSFVKIEKVINPLGQTEAILHVKDGLGSITQVKAKDWQSKMPAYKPQTIKCRVIRFKKGKLQLENLE